MTVPSGRPTKTSGWFGMAPAGASPFVAGAGLLRQPAGLVAHPVPDVDVHHAVGVARHQVAGLGTEDDEAAVGAHGRVDAGAVGLAAAAGDADPLGLPDAPVANEDVAHT